MPTDDRDDPGADTAMFRAYVEETDPATQPAAAPADNRNMIIGLVVAIAVLVLLGIVLLA